MIGLLMALALAAQDPDLAGCTDAELDALAADELTTGPCVTGEPRPGWEYVRLLGWTLRGESDRALMLTMPAMQPNMIWVRYETHEGGERLSARQLVEVDCQGGRYRVVQQDVFTQGNLAGRSEQGGSSAWMYVAPGTLASTTYSSLCDV